MSGRTGAGLFISVLSSRDGSRDGREHGGRTSVGDHFGVGERGKKGELTHARFLFEMIGLYPVSKAPASEEDQHAEEGNDLARVLQQRLALHRSGDDAEETTEIAGVTATGDSVE